MAACAVTCTLSVGAAAAVSTCSHGASSGSLRVQKSILGSSIKFNIDRSVAKRRVLPAPKAVQEETSTSEVTAQTQKVIADLQAKWEKVDDKPSVLIYTGGALVAVWLSSAILGAFDSVPIVPKLFELVGLGFSTWFVYRYLLFTPNRQELYQKIDEITGKITGKDSTEEAKWTGGSGKAAASKGDTEP